MIFDSDSRDDLEFGDVLLTPNQPTPYMINFSLQQQQPPPIQYFPSYEFDNCLVDSKPCPTQAPMPGVATTSPASTTSTKQDDDAVLAYINQFLLEDDDDFYPGANACAEDSALLAVEKPFVDILTAAKPTAASEAKSWVTDGCGSSGSEVHDSGVSSQVSCQLPKGQKNPYDTDLESEERSSKQSVLWEEDAVQEMFDRVLLCTDPNCEFHSPLPADGQIGGGYVKGSWNRRGRRKGKSGNGPEEEAVDLTTFLVHCAQAAAIDDQRSARELRSGSIPLLWETPARGWTRGSLGWHRQ